MKPAVLLLLALLIPAGLSAQTSAGPAGVDTGISSLLRRMERALEANDRTGYSSLLSPSADRSAAELFLDDWFAPGVTRAVIKERLRAESQGVAQGQGYDVYADVLAEFGRRGLIGTWLVELRREPGAAPDEWRITKLTVLTLVRGLYRLDLNPAAEFTVDDLTLAAEDFQARLPRGVAFVAQTENGTTGLVLLGKGTLAFSPAPPAEKGQVRIFSGDDTFRTEFESLYVRLNPADFDTLLSSQALQPRPPDSRDFRRADLIFQENLGQSFGLDLADLSREKWSVVPKRGDLIVEVQAGKRRLAYMRMQDEQEDIRFFDRTRRRVISVYPSARKLEENGPFFDEDDRVDYDILHYDIDASFDPRREWIDGVARMLVVPKRNPVTTLTLSLAEPLVIRSVTSRRFGYLMALRATGQNDVIINLPEPLEPNTILDLAFEYGGRLPAVSPEREAVAVAQQAESEQSAFFTIQPEPSYIYTGASFWYPQGQVTDYATANLRLHVPENYSSVASGALDEGFPRLEERGKQTWKEYHFSATQPVRYLAWAISRFVHVDDAVVTIPPRDPAAGAPLKGVSYSENELSVESSGMLKRRAEDLSKMAQSVMSFYGTLLGDIPYQTFTLAVVERKAPGGHSPPYFASLSQPPPATPIAWRTDPAYFSDFPEFFVAHEVAHQWWGHAVGWKNYHEQWISEGFAQYFAALYAERAHQREGFDRVVRQMTRWTIARSDQGPVYLGYRLGHLRSDPRTFRALVYNKGGIVLHMLRRLIGDEAFFRGLRRFYETWRFKKAGTEDLRMAFEAEAGRPLGRFFDRWIYDAALPRLRFSYTTGADAVVVRLEQVGEVFDLPVTVTVEYEGSSADIIVPLTEAVTERRIPTKGPVRGVKVDQDDAAPVIFVK